MHIIDNDGGGSAIPVDSHKRSNVFPNLSVIKSLPLEARDPTAIQDELLLAWTLACSPSKDDLPSSYDWGYILPDGSVQRQSFRIDYSAFSVEDTTSKALEDIKKHDAAADSPQSPSLGSKLFFGHRPDSSKSDSETAGATDEDVSATPS